MAKITGQTASTVFKDVSQERSRNIEKIKREREEMLLRQTEDDPSGSQMTTHLKPGVTMLVMIVAESWLIDVASDVPQICLEDMMMTYYATLAKVSQERAIQLEQMTRFQGMADDLTANVWLVERRKRITSSTAGQIVNRQTTTKVCSIVKNLPYRQFRGTAPTERSGRCRKFERGCITVN